MSRIGFRLDPATGELSSTQTWTRLDVDHPCVERFACSRCLAPAGTPCVTVDSFRSRAGRVTSPHKTRLDLWDAAEAAR